MSQPIIYKARKIGLANRLRALVGYQALSDYLERQFFLCWIPDEGCNAEFHSLFETELTLIEPEALPAKPGAEVFDDAPWFDRVWRDHLSGHVPLPEFLRKVRGHLDGLVPIASIRDRVDVFASAHGLEKMLGVHIRHTDNLIAYKDWASRHAVFKIQDISSMSGFMTAIDAQLPISPVFLTTDNPEVEQQFRQHYGRQLITYPKQYVDNCQRTSSIECALIEMLLLGRCQGILGTYFSSYSKFSAIWWNTSYREVIGTTCRRNTYVERMCNVMSETETAAAPFGIVQSPERRSVAQPRRAPVKLPGEVWGVSAYFNPAEYANKKEHLRLFSQRVRHQGLKLLIVELAFGAAPYVLEDQLADRIIRIRSDSIMWQKERLLNLGIQHLPESCDKVVCLDADVLFGNDQWVTELSATLREYPLVQPFEKAWWLSQATTVALPRNLCTLSAAMMPSWQLYSVRSTPSVAYGQLHKLHRKVFDFFETERGHYGFAWAARRSLLESCGLYDRSVLGGADSLLAWTVFGYLDASSVKSALTATDHDDPDDSTLKAKRFLHCKRLLNERYTLAQRNDIKQWSERFYSEVAGSVSFLRGPLYHLWHGDRSNRKYVSRLLILKNGEFDPFSDISLNADGCWEWSTHKPEMHEKVAQYFHDRAEESIDRPSGGPGGFLNPSSELNARLRR